MRRIRRFVMLILLLAVVASTALLLDVTAPNPTGRRISSAPVPTISSGLSAQQIGRAAEDVLARDLGVPRNDQSDQRQCFCHNARHAGSPDCNTCALILASIDTSRRPDFITDRYIVEAKNRQDMLYTHADLAGQLQDYADAARALGRPLWLFVRVDTRLSPEFEQIVAATGGGVVYYFATEGYTDPTTSAARNTLLVTLPLLLGALWVEWRPAVRRRKDAVLTAARSVQTAQRSAEAQRDRLRDELRREE
ncbi:MAG: hypothetical protein SF123_11525 [Chloroflexota bacterium]|nr:hypothetical protein [Chloroflexota bacterium]